MNILFLGGDKRYEYMMQNLVKTHSIHQFGFNDIDGIFSENLDSLDLSNFDTVLLPISGINDKQEIKTSKGLINVPSKIFKNIKGHTKFFTGIKTQKLLELIPKKQIISFLDYEEVEAVNNSLTVDGVMDDIKDKRKNNVCILGYRKTWERNIYKA